MNTRSLTQTKPSLSAPAQTGLLQRKCAQYNEQEKLLQRQAVNQVEVLGVPAIVHDVLNSPGQSLDPATRDFMEPRFGYDFSQVRIRTNTKATDSAKAMNALAYTAGHNIAFGKGQYSPKTTSGKRLIAHELTHTIQQQQGKPAIQSFLQLADHNSQQEQEAEDVANAVVQGQPTSISQFHSPQLARQTAKDAGVGEGGVPLDAGQVNNRTVSPGTVMPAPFPPGGWATVYQDEVRVNGSPSWRNNNPGNLVKGAFANNHGAIGEGIKFAVFPDEATGKAAAIENLKTSDYQSKTILEAMKTWAPPSDAGNDPVAYANSIRRITGLEPSRKVSTLNDNELDVMAGAIKTVEGWNPGTTYTRDSSSPEWVRKLLGTSP